MGTGGFSRGRAYGTAYNLRTLGYVSKFAPSREAAFRAVRVPEWVVYRIFS
jgi:hypothetical protein